MNRKLKDEDMDILFRGILKLQTVEDCYDFFEDLCTIAELRAMVQRFQVARMLDEGRTARTATARCSTGSRRTKQQRRAMNSYETLSEYYDRFTDDVGYEEWADFFERLFEREGVKPSLVLDLACGTGSLTRILAQRGYDMIGADASPEMLMQALQNTLDCEPRPLLLNQRMEELDLYGAVDACLCCLDSVNYVTEPEALQTAFERVHTFLNPDGLFVFDINTPEKFTRIDGESYVREDDGVFCVWQAAVEDGLCAYQFDIFEQEDDVWHRAQETHEERIYEPAQLTAMLEQAGFTEIKTYGDQSFAPVQGGEDRIYFTARKRD